MLYQLDLSVEEAYVVVDRPSVMFLPFFFVDGIKIPYFIKAVSTYLSNTHSIQCSKTISFRNIACI